MNKKEKMKLKVLTPIYIGGLEQDNLKQIDYIYSEKENLVKIINGEKLVKYLIEQNKLNLFTEFLRTKSSSNVKLFFDTNNIYNYEERIVGEKIFLEDVYIKDGKPSLNDIVRCIKSVDGKAYIPGSTLKGMIVNAITYDYIKNNRNKFGREKSIIKQKGLRGARNLEFDKNIFINEVDNKKEKIDIRKYIQVSDTTDANETIIVNKKDFSTLKFGNLTELPIYRECIKPGEILDFDIKIDYAELKKLNINNLNDLLNILDNYFLDLIDYQDYIFQNLRCDKIEKYLYSFSENEEANAIIGGGAGFFSKTVLLALFANEKETMKKLIAKYLDAVFKNKKNKLPVHEHEKKDMQISPRTLKLSKYRDEFLVMGMCKIEKE